MATEKTDQPGERPMSMKERLLAQRRAEAAGQGGSAPASTPIPATRPPARPAAAADARPTPSSPTQRAAAPTPRAAAPESRSPTVARAPAPTAESVRAPRRDAKAMSADVQREIEMLRRRQDKWIVYGWIVAGVLILAAGGFWLYVQGRKGREAEARELYIATITKVRDDILAMPLNSLDNANRVLSRAEETKNTIQLPNGTTGPGWRTTWVADIDTRVAGRVGAATSYIRTETTRNELLSGMAALEAGVREAENKKPEELAQLRRRLSEYETGAPGIGADFEARVARARIDLNRAVAKRLFDEAKAVAAKGEARAALAAYAKAEDELRSLMDEAYSKRNQDAISWVEPLYQQCIDESDKICYAAFTPDQIEKTPWVDILATPDIKWANDGLKGFRVDGGQVQAVGSDPGTKREGVFSVGDLEYWRDFVLECEFVPVRGSTKLYWRLGKLTQSAPDEMAVDPSSSEEWKAGQTYSITATYIGSQRTFSFSPNLEREDWVEPAISWRRQRVGAFGAVLAEGAEFKITKLRIKVLRGGKPR